MNKLDWALAHVRAGRWVIPLHNILPSGRCSCGRMKKQKDGTRSPCVSGKHPRTRRGVYDASNNEQQVRKWWREWRHANIGVATGLKYGLLAVDEDGPIGAECSRCVQEQFGAFPETVIARSGSGVGRHRLFLPPDAVPDCYDAHNFKRVSGKRGGQKLQLQGDGSYIVAVGSDHKSGNTYRWEVSPEQMEIAKVPAYMLNGEWRRVAKSVQARLEGTVVDCVPNTTSSVFSSLSTTREDHQNHQNHQTIGTSKRVASDQALADALGTPERLVVHLALTASGQTNDRVWDLMRGLKLNLGLSEHESVDQWGRQWFQANQYHIKDEDEWGLMREKMRSAYETVAIPLGDGARLEEAWRLATSMPLPPEASRFFDSVGLTVALLAQLQAQTPGVPFALSQYQLAGCLTQHRGKPISPRRCYSILSDLQAKRNGAILTLVRKGNPAHGLANIYLYSGGMVASTSPSPDGSAPTSEARDSER